MGQAREIAERYFRNIEQGDVAGALACLAPGAEFINPLGAMPVPDGVRMMLEGYVSGFPDNRFEVKNVIEAGDQVVMEADWVGTHAGPLPLPDGSAVPATGRAVRAPLVTVFRVREGRIVSHRGYWDLAGFLAQLGLSPGGSK
jgi:steroid delta-isomerase-like uncharacterized protein